MPSKTERGETILRGHFILLLISLLLLFVIFPCLEVSDHILRHLIFGIFFAVVLLVSLRMISCTCSVNITAIVAVLAGISLATRMASYLFKLPLIISGVGLVSELALFVYIASHILGFVLKSSEVTADKIVGAICVYFLIGLIWAFIFTFMEYIQAGSFHVSNNVDLSDNGLPTLIYFSFTTLTTLGYGDVAPATPGTQALAALEAAVGQMYLTVLVARLVGLHIYHTRESLKGVPESDIK